MFWTIIRNDIHTTLIQLISNIFKNNMNIEQNAELIHKTSDQLAGVMDAIYQDPSAYGYTNKELSNAYIGQQFKIANLSETNEN